MKYYKFSNYLGDKIRLELPTGKDGQYISLSYCKKEKSPSGCNYKYVEYDENEKFKIAYQYVLDMVKLEKNKFNLKLCSEKECWGVIEKNVVMIKSSQFDYIMKKAGFDVKENLRWLKDRGIIIPDGKGNPKNVKSINSKSYRCVFLRMDYKL